MGGKHLKQLRAERAKVHFKKKKLLPKGQNVTDTTFKAKKIILIEQLKKVDEKEPVTSWNLTLKDLLTRISHHNLTMRVNSLNGIKELITNYPQILLGPALRNIILKILELLIDVEPKVRKLVINLLNEIFCQLPSQYIAPYHDILIVHINCVMTHREWSIQEDALKLIEVVINHAPEALQKNFSTLAENFLRILSGNKYGLQSGVALNKKFHKDLVKAKAESLSKFYNLLKAVYTTEEISAMNNENSIVIFSHENRFDIKKLGQNYKKVSDLSSLFKKSENNEFVTDEDYLNESQSLITNIMSLLFNTWTEFAPNNKSDNFTSECLLSENIAELLHKILDIVLLIFEKICMEGKDELKAWYVSKFGSTFSKSFLLNFPYLPTVSLSESEYLQENDTAKKNSKAYVLQNLSLSYLYYCFKAKCFNSEVEVKIEKFVIDCLQNNSSQGSIILPKVVDIMIRSSKQWHLDEFVSSIIKLHDSTKLPELQKKLFNILVAVALSNKYSFLKSKAHLDKWIKNMPHKLLQEKVPLYVVETLLKIINREAGCEILKEIENRALEIALALPNIIVEEKSQLEGQKLIVNILYRCNNCVLKNIINSEKFTKQLFSKELREYIVKIVSYKFSLMN